jgi:hypothetical protein
MSHGGIPDSWFYPHLAYSWGRAVNDLEDLATETKEHPFFDDFWKTKACDFSRIITPAYIVTLQMTSLTSDCRLARSGIGRHGFINI